MHKGIIIVKQPESALPDDFLASAAKLYPTGWGVAVVTAESGDKELQVEAQTGGSDEIKGKIEEFEKQLVILNLFSQEQDEEIEDDDLQPFVPFFENPDTEDTPILSVFVAGPLHKKWDKGNGYSPAFHFYTDYLKPTLMKMTDGEGIDTIDDLIEEIATNTVAQNAFLSEIGDPDSVIVFFGQNGKHINCTATKNDRHYDWGWVSSGEGFEAPVVGKKKGGLKSSKPTIPIGKDSTLLPADKDKVVTSTPAPAAAADTGMVRVPVPRGLSNKDRKKWLYRATGTNPSNWRELSDVLISKAKAKEMGFTAEDLGPKLGSYPEQAATNVITGEKVTAQKPQLEMPLINSEAKRKSDSFFSTLKLPDDPASFKNMEAKLSNWSDQTGHQIEDIFKWPFDTIRRYVREVPDAADVLLFTMRNLYMSELASHKKPETQEETPPDVAPKKKGGLKKAS